MKTNVITVKNTGAGVSEALAEAERFAGYQGFGPKETLRIRLLAEEIMGLVRNIVGDFDGSFWIEGEGRRVELCLEAVCSVDREQRDLLLKVSTSGKNMDTRGFLGKLTGIFEYGLMSYDTSLMYAGGYMDGMMDGTIPDYGFEKMWSLNAMKEGLRANMDAQEAREEWDELEKSILSAFADEVLVGVKASRTKLIVKKEF